VKNLVAAAVNSVHACEKKTSKTHSKIDMNTSKDTEDIETI
jgi:hypothetical protein